LVHKEKKSFKWISHADTDKHANTKYIYHLFVKIVPEEVDWVREFFYESLNSVLKNGIVFSRVEQQGTTINNKHRKEELEQSAFRLS
jgi:5-bromo-4-chloroindolyl phosphate hydrolysis protein